MQKKIRPLNVSLDLPADMKEKLSYLKRRTGMKYEDIIAEALSCYLEEELNNPLIASVSEYMIYLQFDPLWAWNQDKSLEIFQKGWENLKWAWFNSLNRDHPSDSPLITQCRRRGDLLVITFGQELFSLSLARSLARLQWLWENVVLKMWGDILIEEYGQNAPGKKV